jgi:hypothetical protein
MPPLADAFLPRLSAARALVGQWLGVHELWLVETSWSGEHAGDGSAQELLTPITEAGGVYPKVVELSGKQLALADLAAGSIRFKLTPSFTAGDATGGTSLAKLEGKDLMAGQSLKVRAKGPRGTIDYTIHELEVKAMAITVTCQPITTSP